MEKRVTPRWGQRGADASASRHHNRQVDQPRRHRGGQLTPGMAEACARHHGERHCADRPGRPAVNAGAWGKRSERRSTCQKETDWDERVRHMKNEDELVAGRAVPGPSGKPCCLQHAGKNQRDSGCEAQRQGSP